MKFLSRKKSPIEPLPTGMHHYMSPPENPLNYRLHLRIEEDGQGVLLVNASTVLHLNQTAAEYAYHFIKKSPLDKIRDEIYSRYSISRKKIEQDYKEFEQQIEALITTNDLDPVLSLGFDTQTPYLENLSAPYRLDCALTYQLPDGANTESAPTKRVERELTTTEWKQIIDTAWEAGIPHIVFTGGEPTLREDLPELIEYAELKGQVTGLITNGIKLGDTRYLNKILQAGLDHTMIILEPDEKSSWESLSSFAYWTETLNEDIFVAAHLTLNNSNIDHSFELLDKLTEAGVSAISLSENDKSLTDQLLIAREYVDDLDIELVWDLPVPYSNLNPVALELEMEDSTPFPDGAGKGWLYVEPDGDVLPSQGINQVLGNILKDEWDSIWGNAKK